MYNWLTNGIIWFSDLFTMNILMITGMVVVGVVLLGWILFLVMYPAMRGRVGCSRALARKQTMRRLSWTIGLLFVGLHILVVGWGAVVLPVLVLGLVGLICLVASLFGQCKCRIGCACIKTCGCGKHVEKTEIPVDKVETINATIIDDIKPTEIIEIVEEEEMPGGEIYKVSPKTIKRETAPKTTDVKPKTEPKVARMPKAAQAKSKAVTPVKKPVPQVKAAPVKTDTAKTTAPKIVNSTVSKPRVKAVRVKPSATASRASVYSKSASSVGSASGTVTETRPLFGAKPKVDNTKTATAGEGKTVVTQVAPGHTVQTTTTQTIERTQNVTSTLQANYREATLHSDGRVTGHEQSAFAKVTSNSKSDPQVTVTTGPKIQFETLQKPQPKVQTQYNHHSKEYYDEEKVKDALAGLKTAMDMQKKAGE